MDIIKMSRFNQTLNRVLLAADETGQHIEASKFNLFTIGDKVTEGSKDFALYEHEGNAWKVHCALLKIKFWTHGQKMIKDFLLNDTQSL